MTEHDKEVPSAGVTPSSGRPAALPSPMPSADGYRRVWVERRATAAAFPVGDPSQAEADTGDRSFSVATWNIQAAGTREGVHASDRSGAEECVRLLLHSRELRVPSRPEHPPDILSLQELQRCPRQVQMGDCRDCKRHSCKYDHAGWVSAQLREHGYEGCLHNHGMVQ